MKNTLNHKYKFLVPLLFLLFSPASFATNTEETDHYWASRFTNRVWEAAHFAIDAARGPNGTSVLLDACALPSSLTVLYKRFTTPSSQTALGYAQNTFFMAHTTMEFLRFATDHLGFNLDHESLLLTETVSGVLFLGTAALEEYLRYKNTQSTKALGSKKAD